jgi:hypothetical protein
LSSTAFLAASRYRITEGWIARLSAGKTMLLICTAALLDLVFAIALADSNVAPSNHMKAVQPLRSSPVIDSKVHPCK